MAISADDLVKKLDEFKISFIKTVKVEIKKSIQDEITLFRQEMNAKFATWAKEQEEAYDKKNWKI